MATILAFFMADIVLTAIFGFAAVLSILSFSKKSYGWSTFLGLISIVAVATYFRETLITYSVAHGVVKTAAVFLGGYVIAGLAVGLIYWVFYCWGVKSRYEDLMANRSGESSLRKALADLKQVQPQDISETELAAFARYQKIADNGKELFDAGYGGYLAREMTYGVENAIRTGKDVVTVTNAAVDTILPPRSLQHKAALSAASIQWPVTILWLMLARVITTLVDRFMALSRGFLDGVSRFASGSYN